MRWFQQLFPRRRRYDELHESIQEHLAEKIEDLVEDGMSRENAEQTARRQFGNVTLMEERSREVWQWPRWEAFLADLKFAVHQLFRNPGFTVTVIVTLALSIGANTAIFSIVNALMLKSLPYEHPERMATIFTRITGPEPYEGGHAIDGEQWEMLRDRVPSLISAASSGLSSGVNLEAAQHVQYVHNGRVSAHYLDVLAIHPLIGRNFAEVEDRPNGPKTALLSYGLWHNIFNNDSSLIGQTIHLKGEPYTVIGVLPRGVTTTLNADVYTALQASRTGEGGGSNFEVIARLSDGATWQQADAEINRAWA